MANLDTCHIQRGCKFTAGLEHMESTKSMPHAKIESCRTTRMVLNGQGISMRRSSNNASQVAYNTVARRPHVGKKVGDIRGLTT